MAESEILHEAKAVSNAKKHGVSFETAVLVFEDPRRVEFPERIEGDEERWHAIGSVRGSFVILTVVHTVRDSDGGLIVRVISARRATPMERKLYDQAIL